MFPDTAGYGLDDLGLSARKIKLRFSLHFPYFPGELRPGAEYDCLFHGPSMARINNRRNHVYFVDFVLLLGLGCICR